VKKSDIRKKIIFLRKKKFSNFCSIDEKKFLKFLEKKKISSRKIGGYYSFNYELDILNILELLTKKKYQISLPSISKNNTMNFFTWSTNDPLKINKYGIPEPVSKKKVFPEVLLIPLVAFDDQLNRLGYGGGYYDRYIARFLDDDKIVKIGIGFSFQKVKSLPINKYDKKLDYVITEKNFFE
tara:strand:- start:134 stop:679 length:546 start_codon:yes stop_codon:yes gene_type:complete